MDNVKETVSFYFYFYFTFYQKLPSNILNLSSNTTSIYFDDAQSSLSNNFYKKSRLKIQKSAFSGVEADLEWHTSNIKRASKHFKTKFHSFLVDILKKHDDYMNLSNFFSFKNI